MSGSTLASMGTLAGTRIFAVVVRTKIANATYVHPFQVAETASPRQLQQCTHKINYFFVLMEVFANEKISLQFFDRSSRAPVKAVRHWLISEHTKIRRSHAYLRCG